MTSISLRSAEAGHLAAHTGRLLAWDPAATVRLQVRGGAVGVFAAPPLDCLTLLVLPLAAPAGAADGFDAVVAAEALRAAAALAADDPAALALPPALGPRAELAVLPPREGWLPGETGQAGDVAPLVDRAVEEFRSRAAAEPDASQQRLSQIADEVWSAPGWGGIPLPALHAARLLGMLAHGGYRLAAATAPGWKRLMTPSGQVFVRLGGPPALSLAVLR